MTTITWQSITATAASLKPVKNDKNRAAVKTRQSDTPPSDRRWSNFRLSSAVTKYTDANDDNGLLLTLRHTQSDHGNVTKTRNQDR